MVVYNSQYRKSFEDPHWDKFAVDEYRRKLDYRLGRRSVEHEHQSWSWDSEDEEESNVVIERVSSSRNVVESKPEDRDTGKKHRRRKDIIKTKASERVQEEVAKIPEEYEKDGRKQEKQQQKDKQKVGRHTRDYDNEKPQRRSRLPGRPKTAPATKKTETLADRQPFVFYGWANKAPIERKFTYNVRASPSEVYPASMRALKRRELEIKRKQFENQEKATIIERELAKERLLKTHEVSSGFLTEYQRSYCLQTDGKLGYNSD